jgi:hypothetical protein
MVEARAALLAILEARELAIDDNIHQQIERGSLTDLTNWLRRAATSVEAAEVFGKR